MSKTKGNDQNPPPQGRNRRKGEVSDGQHAQIQAISKGQKPSAFFVRNNPNWEVHVFRVVKPFVPLAGTGWHPYTFESVKRGVDPRVARCWQLRKSPRYSRFAGPGDHLRPTRHFFGRFFGQPLGCGTHSHSQRYSDEYCPFHTGQNYTKTPTPHTTSASINDTYNAIHANCTKSGIFTLNGSGFLFPDIELVAGTDFLVGLD